MNERVARSVLPNGRVVSTVYIGAGCIKYETMVFPDEKTWAELDCERYETREEAEDGHTRMVEKHKEKTR